MARINVTGDQVLASVVARLRAALDFDESTCYEVSNPDDVPAIPISGDWWVTVAGGDGQFEQGEQEPGQCSEETEVSVTAYTRILTDRTDHDYNILHDPDRGCYFMKGKILSALVGYDLTTETGNTFLRQQLRAFRASPPRVGAVEEMEGLIGKIQLVFRIEFDWQLERL